MPTAAVVAGKGDSSAELGALAMLPHQSGQQNGHGPHENGAVHDPYLTGSAAPSWLGEAPEPPARGSGETPVGERLQGPVQPPISPFQTWGSGMQR